MRIGELARIVSVATSAIRHWEAEGLLDPPRRVSGVRDYDDAAVARVRLIRGCQSAGFTIAETRAFLRAMARRDRPLSESWRKAARAKLAELDETATRIDAMRTFLRRTLRCDCTREEDCRVLNAASSA